MDFAVVLDPDRFAPERLRQMGMAELQGWAESAGKHCGPWHPTTPITG